MDREKILEKLENYLKEMDLLKSCEEVATWSSKVAPLIELVNKQYWINFLECAHRFNLNLSRYSLEPAFKTMKHQLQMAIEELKIKIEIENSLPEEIYFPPNSPLSIQKHIAKIIRQAKNYLWVADPYMDEKIIEELTEVLAEEVRLLTNKEKGLFLQRLKAAREELKDKKIEVKRFSDFHDRFYIIDKTQVWMLGSSYNQAGKKATLLSKVKNNNEKKKIISDFETWWSKASDLNL